MSRRAKGTGSVYERAGGSWVASLDVGWTQRGTRRRITRRARTEREAKQKLRALEREFLLNGAPDDAASARITVKGWSETWLERQERALRPQPFATTRSYVNRWVVPTIGHKRLDALSPGDVRAVAVAMERAGLATATVARGHGELIHMLNDAHADGHAVPARAREVKMSSGGSKRHAAMRDALPIADALAVLDAARDRPDRARWVVALMTGLRPAEARGLTWDRVDFERGTITVEWQLKPLPYKIARDRTSGLRIPRDYEARHLHDAYHLVHPKTDSGFRVIPMVAMVADALREWAASSPRSPHGLVFPDRRGKALRDDADRAAWRDLCEAAGVGERDLYEARHTTATLLRAYGAPEEVIIAIMGHSSILSTKAYLHSDLDRARESLMRIESAMTRQIGA